ncbi:hypothetical protein RCL1_003410 [Eukaryota sp. TZLM3-RCL]
MSRQHSREERETSHFERKQGKQTRFFEGGAILPFNLGKAPTGGCIVDYDRQEITESGPFSADKLERLREIKHLGHEEPENMVIYEGGRVVPEMYGGGKAPPGGLEIDKNTGERRALDPELARSKGYQV